MKQSPLSQVTTVARRALSASSLLFGLDPRRILATISNAPRFARDALAYRTDAAQGRFPLRWRQLQPMLLDWNDQAGTIGGHYFHQDLWCARKIFAQRPASHLDVGSRIDGFVAHVLTFMPVTVIDIRSLDSTVEGLSFLQQDATNLAGIPDNSVESMSSLHAVEHFGLGRYGDPVDPNACFRAMHALARVIKPNGRLYFSVPVGVERVEFNAQRVFAPGTILEEFAQLRLVSFSAVGDDGHLMPDVDPRVVASARLACGLFEFTKTS